jgi:hypothetical protein
MRPNYWEVVVASTSLFVFATVALSAARGAVPRWLRLETGQRAFFPLAAARDTPVCETIQEFRTYIATKRATSGCRKHPHPVEITITSVRWEVYLGSMEFPVVRVSSRERAWRGYVAAAVLQPIVPKGTVLTIWQGNTSVIATAVEEAGPTGSIRVRERDSGRTLNVPLFRAFVDGVSVYYLVDSGMRSRKAPSEH